MILVNNAPCGPFEVEFSERESEKERDEEKEREERGL